MNTSATYKHWAVVLCFYCATYICIAHEYMSLTITERLYVDVVLE